MQPDANESGFYLEQDPDSPGLRVATLEARHDRVARTRNL